MDKPTKSPPVERDVCGTYKGATRHRYYKEYFCNPCRLAFNAHMAEYHRQHRLKYPDKVKQWSKDKYDKNPEKQREAQNRWREKNLDRERAYQTVWREANREKIKEYAKAFRETEKGHVGMLLAAHTRRARKYATRTERYTVQQILDLYGTDCHICGEPIDLTAPRAIGKGEGWEKGLNLDHVIPLSKGGTDTIDNIKPSHGKCNIKKSTK